MKISVNDTELFTLNETQKNVIKNDIHADVFDDDMKRRLNWILMHKYDRCFERLKKQWEPILAKRYESVPTDRDQFAQLVFDQPDYKDRQTRDAENPELQG